MYLFGIIDDDTISYIKLVKSKIILTLGDFRNWFILEQK